MAVKWSWAFGAETPTTMRDYMGWSFDQVSTFRNEAVTTPVYTYASFPGTKYSMALSDDDVAVPSSAVPVQGWYSVAMQPTVSYRPYQTFMVVYGGGSGRSIYIQVASESAWNLYVDNTYKETFTAPALGDWHYIALKYDMSTSTWSGQVYVNGSAATASYTNSRSAETSASAEFRGMTDGYKQTFMAQIIFYDDLADSGETPVFVSRVGPTADTSSQGTWTPSSGATNFGVTANNPYDNATYTQEPTPSSGDNVVTQAVLATELGLFPGVVRGGTCHSYSSGTNLQAFASIRDSGGAYTNGATVTPDSADTTYAYGTSTGLTGQSTINVKYEVV